MGHSRIAAVRADKSVSTDTLLFRYASLLTCKPLEIVRSEGKKPYFRNNPLYFSVSHSGLYWVCAFSESQVGVDIQLIKKCGCRGIAKRFFSHDEFEYLDERGFIPAEFFKIWTAKESYVKYTGEGIGNGFSRFCVVDGGTVSGVNLNVKFNYIEYSSDYVMCLCSESDNTWEWIT